MPMGIVFKQGSLTTISSYLGVIIGYVNVLWLFPAILSPEQIGLVRLLPSIAYLLLPFCQLGLAQSVVKFFPVFNKHSGGREELLTFMLIANIVGFGLTIAFIKIFQSKIIGFFQEKSALVNDYFYISIILLLIFSLSAILESFSKSILKIVIPNVIRDVVIRLLTSAFLAFLLFGIISFDQFVNGLIAIYTIGLLLLLSYLIKKGIMGIGTRFKTLNGLLCRQIVGYGLFTVLGATGNYIILHIDQVMISKMIGLDANGIYTTAFYIAVVIELPRRAIGQISLPLVSRYFESKDLASINKLYKQVSVNQMIVGALILIGIIVNIDNLFELVPNKEIYQTGINVVFIMGLAKLFDMIFSINNEIILMSEFYRYNILFSFLVGLFCVLLNWILIQSMGIDGAALATGICLLLFNVIKLLFIKLKLDLWPFTRNNLYVGLIALTVYFVIQQIPWMGNVVVDIILRSVITTALFSFPVLYFKLSLEINEAVHKITGFKI